MPIGVIYLKIMSEFPAVAKFVGFTLAMVGSFYLGIVYEDVQHRDPNHAHEIQVHRSLGDRTYWVQRVEFGKLIGKPYRFVVCAHEVDPEFDPGMRVDVEFKETWEPGGECNTLYSYEAVTDHGKLIYFSEGQ